MNAMSAARPLPEPWTIEDFLAWERRQPERYEWLDGRILMMTGGTAAHAIIKGNVFAHLRAALAGGRCRAIHEGLKVATPQASMYPDVLVVCGPLAPEEDVVREPVVIVEVLSRTTAGEDRGTKWVAYREIPSLRHYVLIAQDARRAEVFSRSGDEWTFRMVEPPEPLCLPDIGAELRLDDIYEDSGR